MDRLQNIEAFVRVANTQSFAEAARQLRVAKSVVTTRVKQLEDYLGAPLFHRSTRVVRLSELGEAYLRDCSELVVKASDIVDQMRDVHGTPAGRLRVQVIPGLVHGQFASLLQSFQASYPDIRLDLTVSDIVIDPVKAGVDCALQIFPSSSTDVVSKPLFPVRRVFCASPEYLKQFGSPKEPRELHHHRLGLYSGYPTRDRWTFYKDDQQLTTYLSAAMLTNSVHLLSEYALEKGGIVCLPTLVAADSILKGKLTVVMPEQLMSSFWLSAVYSGTSRNTLKLRVFIDHIVKEFSREPPWDMALISRNLILGKLIES